MVFVQVYYSSDARHNVMHLATTEMRKDAFINFIKNREIEPEEAYAFHLALRQFPLVVTSLRLDATLDHLKTIEQWFSIPLRKTPYGVFVDNTPEMPVWRVYRTLTCIRMLTDDFRYASPSDLSSFKFEQILACCFEYNAQLNRNSPYLPADDWYDMVRIYTNHSEDWKLFVQHLAEFFVKQPAKDEYEAWQTWCRAEELKSGFSIARTIRAIKQNIS